MITKEHPPVMNIQATKDEWITGTHEQLQQRILTLLQTTQEQAETIQNHRAYKNMVGQIMTNHDMTYSDRVLWTITLNNHPNEMLALKPFQANISRLRQQSGVSPDSATKFFASMQEAKGIKYANKVQQGEDNNYTSFSIVTPLTDHARANTRAATLRIKQRTETTKRRRARKMIIQTCENCGSDDLDQAYAAIIPICRNCNHISTIQQEIVLAKNIRIIEEEIIPPTTSHEFSEVTDHEWQEEENDTGHEFSEVQTDISPSEIQANTPAETIHPGHEFSEAQTIPSTAVTSLSHEFSEVTDHKWQEEENDTGHEFSEVQTDTSPSEIQANTPAETIHPGHEFSEGMRVDTPSGIGTISIISCVHNHIRCGVRLLAKQPNGSYYGVFSLTEIQPVIQSSLL